MTMSAIRTMRPSDAEAIGAMMREFAAYLRSLGDESELNGSAEMVRRYGFGSNPAFAGLVAELDGGANGYLLYHFGFDADRACRIVHVIDLYVRESARCHGVARALMERAREICRDAGGGGLAWSVYKPNKLAAGFYERLGAEWIRDLDFMFWRIERRPEQS
jgi:GNAT superfamily N-acetyltransferase